MTAVDAEPNWRAWVRLMPPRRARGDSRNIARSLVGMHIGFLSDAERNLVADFVDAVEAGGPLPTIERRLETKALAIVQLKREHADAWAPIEH